MGRSGVAKFLGPAGSSSLRGTLGVGDLESQDLPTPGVVSVAVGAADLLGGACVRVFAWGIAVVSARVSLIFGTRSSCGWASRFGQFGNAAAAPVLSLVTAAISITTCNVVILSFAQIVMNFQCNGLPCSNEIKW